MNTVIQKLNSGDAGQLAALLQVFEEVFDITDFKKPADSYLEEILRKKENLVFVALKERQIVGGLTAYILPAFDAEKSMLYIYDVAVLPEFQRRGIGGKLISEIKSYCSRECIDTAFVQAEETDDYAVDFYRKTGGQEVKVALFAYPLHNGKA